MVRNIKILSIFLICSFSLNCSDEIPISKRPAAPNLSQGYYLNADGTPSKPLQDIFKSVEANVYLEDPKALNAYAQANFLRQGERQDQQPHAAKYEAMATQLEPAFKELGLTDEVKLTQQHYDGIILLGSFFQVMQQKTTYLNKLFATNPAFTAAKVFYLVGERDLHPQMETPAVKKMVGPDAVVQYKTETDVVPLLWQQAVTDTRLKEVPFEIINAPKKIDPQTGQLTVRPNTADTIKLWCQQAHPKPGRYLVITVNPFVGYQAATFRTHMTQYFGRGPVAIGAPLKAQEWTFETIGPFIDYSKINPGLLKQRTLIILDSIARQLYTEVMADLAK